MRGALYPAPLNPLLLTFRGTDEALEAMTYEDAEGVPLPPGPEVEREGDG